MYLMPEGRLRITESLPTWKCLKPVFKVKVNEGDVVGLSDATIELFQSILFVKSVSLYISILAVDEFTEIIPK